AHSVLRDGPGAAIPELSDEFKQRARLQWTDNPCGTHVASDLEFGTRAFFDRIEEARYRFSPWMKELVPFGSYKGRRVMEIGCGTGTDLIQFARAGAIVTGLDLTPRSIEIARKRFDIYGLPGEFLIGDAENLAFPDESFDGVYSFGVLHHTPKTEKAVAEVYRILKPGATATIMLYHKHSLYYWGYVILNRGLLHGALAKEKPADIMSRVVEYPNTGRRPLVKVYTRTGVRKLFRQFETVSVNVRQLERYDLGLLGRLLPEPAFRSLEHNFGWNIIISATKGARH
ncbi:MAG TPA: class I SAM-dependent methyltransferase, partial [Blastocatellia bacterium]